jgi:glycosyltransferase involved in cell wall biosynthesis
MTDESGRVRVLRLFSRLNVGGPSIHVLLLTSGLESRGYSTRLLVGRESPHEGNLLELARSRGVNFMQVETLGREVRPLSDFRSFQTVFRIIRDFEPTIVHTHTAKAGLLGRSAAWLAGVPVIVHTYHGHVLRGYFGCFRTLLFRALEALLACTSDALIAVSDSVKRDLMTLGVAGSSKIHVVPLGLDLSGFEAPLPKGGLRVPGHLPDQVPVVGVVGRLVRIKDLRTFLAAASIVRKSMNQVYFSVVGDGVERSLLERLTNELGLAQAVRFHGWVSDPTVIYGDLNVVVNSSRSEGTPVALIEAMAAGVPVVATNVGGTPDLLGGGSRGLLVPPGDPQSLADGILAVLRGGDDVTRRAQAAREYVLRHHSSERLIADVDALYKHLLAREGVA